MDNNIKQSSAIESIAISVIGEKAKGKRIINCNFRGLAYIAIKKSNVWYVDIDQCKELKL